MAYQVKVTREVKDYVASLAEYLVAEWGYLVADNFLESYYEAIRILGSFPHSGQKVANKKWLRRILVTKQNTLYYTIKGNEVLLLLMIDSRSEPLFEG